MAEAQGPRRLFIDCETSPNIVYSWRIGRKIDLDHSNIIKERAIITICYKWAGEESVKSLTWDKDQNDKEMLRKFVLVMNSADEIIAHNGDRFDLPWIRTRCIFHRIPMPSTLPSVDTLKQARRGFNFNSNRLDYLGGFLGHGHKQDTGGFGLWKSVMDGSRKSLSEMVVYCKRDVELLEKVYNELYSYTKPTIHVGVLTGGYRHSCPKCGSSNTHRSRKSTTAMGTPKVQLHCNDCNAYWTMAESTYIASMKLAFMDKHGLDTTKSKSGRKGKDGKD